MPFSIFPTKREPEGTSVVKTTNIELDKEGDIEWFVMSDRQLLQS